MVHPDKVRLKHILDASKDALSFVGGFTLLEVIVVLFIFSLIFLLGGQILFSSLKTTSKSQLQAEVKQEAQKVLSVMERELHNAKSVKGGGCGAGSIHYFDPTGGETWFYYSSSERAIKHRRSDGSIISLTSTQVQVPVDGFGVICGADLKSVVLSLTVNADSQSTRPEDLATVTLNTRILLRN